MLKQIKTILYTLATVIVFIFGYLVWDNYKEKQVNVQETEMQEVVDTLAEIIAVKKPDFEHDSNQTFIESVGDCVNYIYNTTSDIMPVNLELLLAQAALESGWGTSRFAREGKNLFGIRTYDLREPHMLPSNNPKKWGVKVYMHECDSVQHYMDILNNGTAFEEYRKLKHEQGINDPFKLLKTLGAYASDENYFIKVKSIIKKLRTEYELPIIQ